MIKPNLWNVSEADLFKSDLQEIKYLLAKSLETRWLMEWDNKLD